MNLLLEYQESHGLVVRAVESGPEKIPVPGRISTTVLQQPPYLVWYLEQFIQNILILADLNNIFSEKSISMSWLQTCWLQVASKKIQNLFLRFFCGLVGDVMRVTKIAGRSRKVESGM